MVWQDYLAGFHRDRAGITDEVLRRSHDGGNTPYEWLVAAVPEHGFVLDVACGSAPLWRAVGQRRYLGLDVSAAELAVARRSGAGPLVRASAAAIPARTGSVDVVVCSMALMVMTPLPVVLADVHRVLVRGGRLVATVPGRGPLRRGDWAVMIGLMVMLGRRLRYPNDDLLDDLDALLPASGLRVESDEHRRFGYRLNDRSDVDRFLDSLYLPDLPSTRYRVARAYLRACSRWGIELALPIRRIVATAR
ncbi:class I SAM-dependent methyltransferase [Amycolatopsis echigonensis]|uniref:Class I SAM-dependent methyltransferase n=1 Tax=Amycolatopsis echigonensis TaxID=2576905 RepID=A0A8E1W4U6_9PSEU|nr:class I SAM-dependent methyltransferase [Amycolatopsis echigonensis]MBB2504041.1 class I SAM-dependent methyltransferase [Amycolatopsis echigonensis]